MATVAAWPVRAMHIWSDMTIPNTPPDTEIDPKPAPDLPPGDPDEDDVPGPPPTDPWQPEPGVRAPGADELQM